MPVVSRRLAAWVVFAVSVTACSHAMQTVPFDWPVEKQPECSSRWAAPVADLAVAALAAGLLFSGALAVDEEEGAGPGLDLEEPMRYLFVGVTGTIYLLSSGKGFLNIVRCKRAWRRHLRWRTTTSEPRTPDENAEPAPQ